MPTTPRLDAADIITQATMATTLVKMLVDLVKLCWAGHPPDWVPPLTALGAGIGVLALLAVALDQDLTQSRIVAQTILAGLMAAVGAIGVTELHKLARQAAPGGIGEHYTTAAAQIPPLEVSQSQNGSLFHQTGAPFRIEPASISSSPVSIQTTKRSALDP
jgi:hypothetical protein